MSTSFYLIRKLNKEDKAKLQDYIDNDMYDDAVSLINDSNLHIHIGTRSYGWKFLWHWHNFIYFTDKKSLYEFLKTGIIKDEYGKVFTFDEFVQDNISFIDNPTGYDLEKYYGAKPNEPFYFYVESSIRDLYKETYNIDVNRYGEFYIDDLRFTINE